MSVTVDLGSPQTFSEIVMDAGNSIGDFLRRYTIQVCDDGHTWTDIAVGPGRPSLTGEMVIALPPTTARHLRRQRRTPRRFPRSFPVLFDRRISCR